MTMSSCEDVYKDIVCEDGYKDIVCEDGYKDFICEDGPDDRCRVISHKPGLEQVKTFSCRHWWLGYFVFI